MVCRGKAFNRRFQVRMPFQSSPGHDGLFTGFFDQPKGANIQNPEWPDFFDFVPKNKVLPFMQMNPQGAEPHGSLGHFLQQPGIYQPSQEERHEPNQMLPTENQRDKIEEPTG